MESFNACESLSDSGLKGFVLFVYFSEFFLSVILNDVTHVNLCRFKKCFCFIRVCMITNFDLLTLNFNLLRFGILYLYFFSWSCRYICGYLLFNTKFFVSLSTHLFNKLFFVCIISSFLNFV